MKKPELIRIRNAEKLSKTKHKEFYQLIDQLLLWGNEYDGGGIL